LFLYYFQESDQSYFFPPQRQATIPPDMREGTTNWKGVWSHLSKLFYSSSLTVSRNEVWIKKKKYVYTCVYGI